MGHDNSLAPLPQPGDEAVFREIAALPGHAGQHDHGGAVLFEDAAGCGAHGVAKHSAACRQIRLLPVQRRGLGAEHGGQILPDLLQDLRVKFQFHAEGPAHGLLGKVVVGGAQPPGEDQQIAAASGDGDDLRQPGRIVAHGGVVQHVHAYGRELLREELGVGVGDVPQQQLRAHGDDLRTIGHGISSFFSRFCQNAFSTPSPWESARRERG